MGFLDFGGMNPIGAPGGMGQNPFGSIPPPTQQMSQAQHGAGHIGGPDFGGRSQSQQGLGGGPSAAIPNVAGFQGAQGTQSGIEPQTRDSFDKLGFLQKQPQKQDGPNLRPIPTQMPSRTPHGSMGAAGPQKIADTGAAMGGQPLMGDLQQSPMGGQKGQGLSFADTTAQLESSGGTNTRNLISPGHVGKYQMGQAAFKRFGTGDMNDPAAQEHAFQNYTNYNRNALGQILGRQATDPEVYLSYQQGLHGAHQLLSNPDKPAGSLVKPDHISANGGDPRAPASQFVQMITQKWNEAAGGGLQGGQAEMEGQ